MKNLLKCMTIVLSLIAGLQAMEREVGSLEICPKEITSKILTEVVKDNYVNLDFTNFLEIVRPLGEVCKEWNGIINNNFMHNAMVLGCEQICPGFSNGKLIYRPVVGSDEGMIELLISKLWNPLGGTFDLSGCGDTYNYFSISTGYRKGKIAENASKLEIWFAPRFLIGKELPTTASHFQGIYDNWDESAAVGMFWTWGGWENRSNNFDYLTTESMDNLYKIELYECWKKSKGGCGGSAVAVGCGGGWVVRCISCAFCELK